jgi:hypothetical protein
MPIPGKNMISYLKNDKVESAGDMAQVLGPEFKPQYCTPPEKRGSIISHWGCYPGRKLV